MTKTLEKYQAEWQKRRKKLTLRKALVHCRERRKAEPVWLHDAIYQFGRDLILGMKKTGRPTDLVRDDQIFATVEDHIQAGLTQEEAFARTAEIYADELPPNRNRGQFGQSHTVKNIWLRHKKRIEPPKREGWGDWSIKEKYLRGHDKNAWMNVPPYLRHTKNK